MLPFIHAVNLWYRDNPTIQHCILRAMHFFFFPIEMVHTVHSQWGCYWPQGSKNCLGGRQKKNWILL